MGLYYVDVWIEDGKILLELKVAPAIAPIHKAQAISYLKVTDADLAIVANYGVALLSKMSGCQISCAIRSQTLSGNLGLLPKGCSTLIW